MAESGSADPFLLSAFEVALEDAGVDGREFHLLACPGAAVSSARAAWYPPNEHLEEDDLLVGPILDEANSPDVIIRHRIAVFEDVDEDDPLEIAILTAKLRHEIEHARQYMACGHSMRELDAITSTVLGWKAGGLDGSGVFYNLKPLEQDANAAAAMLLRRSYAEHVACVLETDDAALARSLTPPGEPGTLMARTVCFLFLFAETAEDPARGGSLSFDRRLELAAPGAGVLWQQLKVAAATLATP
jgi:hypothetical protein